MTAATFAWARAWLTPKTSSCPCRQCGRLHTHRAPDTPSTRKSASDWRPIFDDHPRSKQNWRNIVKVQPGLGARVRYTCDHNRTISNAYSGHSLTRSKPRQSVSSIIGVLGSAGEETPCACGVYRCPSSACERLTHGRLDRQPTPTSRQGRYESHGRTVGTSSCCG